MQRGLWVIAVSAALVNLYMSWYETNKDGCQSYLPFCRSYRVPKDNGQNLWQSPYFRVCFIIFLVSLSGIKCFFIIHLGRRREFAKCILHKGVLFCIFWCQPENNLCFTLIFIWNVRAKQRFLPYPQIYLREHQMNYRIWSKSTLTVLYLFKTSDQGDN